MPGVALERGPIKLMGVVLCVTGLALLGCPAAVVSPTPHASIASPTPLPALSPPPAGTATQPLDSATVHMRNHAFMPMTVYVRQGGTVTWLNDDQDVHGAAPANGAAFTATGRLGRGEDSGRITFAKAGEQDYICAYHGTEKGVVMVVATPASAAP